MTTCFCLETLLFVNPGLEIKLKHTWPCSKFAYSYKKKRVTTFESVFVKKILVYFKEKLPMLKFLIS